MGGEKVFCPKCGTENDDSAKFCKKCGSSLILDSIKNNHSMAYQDTFSKNDQLCNKPKSNNDNKSKFKENKTLIIAIIIVIIVAGCAAGYILLQPHYKEINVIGVSMEVPDSDCNVTINSQSTNTYTDKENQVVVYGFDSTNMGLDDIGEAIAFAAVRDGLSENSKEVTIDGIAINESTNGTYSYYTYFGHKNIFIVTKDENTLVHIVKSLNANSNEENNDNTTNESSNLTIISGDITTGSSLSSKTTAHIYVGAEHAGETIKISATYSRDGENLNNGNIVSKTVDSEGYVTFNSAEGFSKYPDYAIIDIYDDSGKIISSKSVTLSASSGTQSF